MKKTTSFFVLLAFLISCVMPPQGFAQTLTAVGLMPQPGSQVALSPVFTPAHLKGMVINPTDPFKFDFIVSRGDEALTATQKQEEYSKLFKYFLAALAVPDTDQWVNLSPFEKDRIISDGFGLTEMGRDLLAQDYLLKQITASLTNPDTDLGKKFWDGFYAQAYKKFGTTDVPSDTFNKVWIIPDKAAVYEKGNSVVVLEHHLKVMMESDYRAMRENSVASTFAEDSEPVKISKQVMREVIIPAIEKEVNEGKNFAPLRQVYSGMLLATWYKMALKESILGKLYADVGKVKGIDQDPKNNQDIYNRYLAAFKKGVVNMIKDDVDSYSQEVIPRKYFSGGASNVNRIRLEEPGSRRTDAAAAAQAGKIIEGMDYAEVAVINSGDSAMMANLETPMNNLSVAPPDWQALIPVAEQTFASGGLQIVAVTYQLPNGTLITHYSYGKERTSLFTLKGLPSNVTSSSSFNTQTGVETTIHSVITRNPAFKTVISSSPESIAGKASFSLDPQGVNVRQTQGAVYVDNVPPMISGSDDLAIIRSLHQQIDWLNETGIPVDAIRTVRKRLSQFMPYLSESDFLRILISALLRNQNDWTRTSYLPAGVVGALSGAVFSLPEIEKAVNIGIWNHFIESTKRWDSNKSYDEGIVWTVLSGQVVYGLFYPNFPGSTGELRARLIGDMAQQANVSLFSHEVGATPYNSSELFNSEIFSEDLTVASGILHNSQSFGLFQSSFPLYATNNTSPDQRFAEQTWMNSATLVMALNQANFSYSGTNTEISIPMEPTQYAQTKILFDEISRRADIPISFAEGKGIRLILPGTFDRAMILEKILKYWPSVGALIGGTGFSYMFFTSNAPNANLIGFIALAIGIVVAFMPYYIDKHLNFFNEPLAKAIKETNAKDISDNQLLIQLALLSGLTEDSTKNKIAENLRNKLAQERGFPLGTRERIQAILAEYDQQVQSKEQSNFHMDAAQSISEGKNTNDSAMSFPLKVQDPTLRGGIDFAQSNLNMQIKRDGAGVLLPISQQNLDSIHIDGLVPVILNIRPAAGALVLG